MSDHSDEIGPLDFDWTFGLDKPNFRLAAAILDRWADDEGQPPAALSDRFEPS